MAKNVNTILLKGYGHHEEGKAAAAGFLPGQGVVLNADGEYQLAADASQGLKFLKEDALQGRTINDAYKDGDLLFIYQPVAGDHIHVLVEAGQDISIGDVGSIVNGFAQEGIIKTFEFLESSDGALAENTHLKARIL